MRTDKIRIEYCLEMLSRFHCGTGYSFGLIDRMAKRDSQGYLVVPGSTIKGLIRENCEKIMQMCSLESEDPHHEKNTLIHFNRPRISDMIFGSSFFAGSLFFNSAVMVEADKGYFNGNNPGEEKRYLRFQAEPLVQTSISRQLGTVKQQALFQSEYGLNSLKFQGEIFGFLQGVDLNVLLEELEGSDSLLLLLAGICLIEKLGSDRTRGAGSCRLEISSLQVNEKEKDPNAYLDSLDCFILLHGERGDKL